MKRSLAILLALCLLLSCTVIFTGCGGNNSTKDWPVAFGDITIDKEPENIVVLNDALADVISYIGYDIKMVGRSAECDQEYFYVVPTMGTAAAPDTEAIIAAQTDLVIADSSLSASARNTLSEAGIKVVQIEPATSEETLRQLYIDLGTVLGGKTTGSAKGENGFNELFKMLNTLSTASSGIVQTVAYLYLDESGRLCTFTQGSLEQKFFEYNGGTDVFMNQTSPAVDTAELRISSPGYIFYDTPEVIDALRADEALSRLNGLVSDHMLQIPKKSFSRCGASVEEAVFAMLDYIEKISKSTGDEAAASPTVAATTAATEAPAEAETEAEDTPEYVVDDTDYDIYDTY